jgi:hypothetical protein
MTDRGKKWLMWCSLMMLIFSIAGLIISGMVKNSKVADLIRIICTFALIISLLNLGVLFSIKYQNRKWLKKTTMISLFLLPVFATGVYFLAQNTSFLDSGLLSFLAIILLFLLMLLALIYVFILRKVTEMRGILVLLLFIVISVVLQRIEISSSAVQDLFLPGFIILTAIGLYMYGMSCLFIIEKNRFLKTISFIACTITAFGSFLFFLKMTGEKVENLELVYFIPAFIMTLVVLLSLPISGYIHWSLLHKRILKKVAIAWIFFLLVFSIRFLYPDFFKQMVYKEYKEYPEFFLKDYKIPDKNGLEPG